jgi:hypothetical protein
MMRCGRSGSLLRAVEDGLGPVDVPIEGILIGKHALREGLADDDERVFVSNVKFAEITAGKDRNPQRRKEPGRDITSLRAGVLFARPAQATFDRELHAEAEILAPRDSAAECGLVDSTRRMTSR